MEIVHKIWQIEKKIVILHLFFHRIMATYRCRLQFMIDFQVKRI